SSGLPGAIRAGSALPGRSRRKSFLRAFGSGPWHWKQLFDRIGRTSRLKSTGFACWERAADGRSATSAAATRTRSVPVRKVTGAPRGGGRRRSPGGQQAGKSVAVSVLALRGAWGRKPAAGPAGGVTRRDCGAPRLPVSVCGNVGNLGNLVAPRTSPAA